MYKESGVAEMQSGKVEEKATGAWPGLSSGAAVLAIPMSCSQTWDGVGLHEM